MKIVRKTNSTWSEIDRNIKLLEHAGIVESRFHGKKRLIKLNNQEDTIAILKALKILEMTTLDQLLI